MLSRRHYQEIAKIIAESRWEWDPVGYIQENLSSYFAQENPRFDKEKFLAACHEHEHDYLRSTYCGAMVCDRCGDHQGFDRCYCGWAVSGGNGRQELIEMGENID
ncbi:MAG: hypothetical protein GWN86_07055 [Desulfobacterales bacterium]|nr:hypothetical protein [Desulfobacterales bacterium]